MIIINEEHRLRLSLGEAREPSEPTGSGSEVFEPRLVKLRLRLEVFEPMLFINNYSTNQIKSTLTIISEKNQIVFH
jgi:hypothetical protein